MHIQRRYLGLEPRLSGSVQGAGGGTDGSDGQQGLGLAGAGVIGPASAEKNCKSVYLSVKQQQICSRSPPVLQAVSAGTRLAIEECQHQFRSARWNCSVSPDNPDNIFGGVMLVNSREAAFVYAISAAGIAYSVTRACSRGELTDCSCDNRIRTRRPNNWQWGGCSEDIHFGDKFSREWTDGAEESVKEGILHGVKGLAGQLMRKHDSEAGRRAVRSKMKRICKCHGMSGSCSVRVCWRRLPAFREAGTDLAALHDGAALVRLAQRGGRKPARLRPAQPDLKRPNKTDLVYLEDSPDYCERNITLGIPGTRGRICNRTSPGLDGCRLLCCGRGYQTRVRDVTEKCSCRFVWCCHVKCELCRQRREEHICN
ncbi:protein Wnt-1-like isoform X2 [Vespula pensylvanica]|uniref:protein Wnt-1-like isoform X2 n=1 Tax=Vespula pensylvanica TaxID=30213 RepID=UPI001CB9E437|nr:protein Wnt-1-like isoform X2 [Vespula pensylvanica]XP_050852017.1 protein Wnt-1-like isoform X2 [Vespula vulgaris]